MSDKRDTTVLVDVRLLANIPLTEYVKKTFDSFMGNGFRVILFAGSEHGNTKALEYFYHKQYHNVLIWRDGSVSANIKFLSSWKFVTHDPKCASELGPRGVALLEYERKTNVAVYDIRCNITEEASSYSLSVFSEDFTLPMEIISNDVEGNENEDFIVLDYSQRNRVKWVASNLPYWKYIDARKEFNSDISVIIKKRVGDLAGYGIDLIPIAKRYKELPPGITGVGMSYKGLTAMCEKEQYGDERNGKEQCE